MNIVVGSQNEPKIMAVQSSFSAAFPDVVVHVNGVSTDSGVSSHPTSAEESIRGALNRAQQAKQITPGADYYVGIEGGLLQVGDRHWEVGFVAIMDGSGKVSTGLSAGIEVSGKILSSIKDGVELSHVLDRDFGVKSAGHKNGFNGLATNDLVTRQAASEQGITFALAPFLHPEYYE